MSDASQLGLGRKITTPQERDAIHVAVAPVKAGYQLRPGQRVNVVDGIAQYTIGEGIGIVDPFFRGFVEVGDTFWLFLYPGSITSLRHDWTHPAFAATPKDASEAWMANYAAGLGMSVADILEAGRAYYEDGDYLNHGSRFEGTYLPDEYWDHFEKITGTRVLEESRGSFFSCSC